MEIKDYVHARILQLPQLAESYIKDDKKRYYSKRHIFVKLKQLVDDFCSGKSDLNRFIVLSGLRGIGKTTLVMQLYNYLIEQLKVSKNNILYISMDEIQSFLNCQLSTVITSYLEDELKITPIKLTEKVFIFVDEAHYDKNWNPTLKAITDLSKNIFVIATGSSALSLDITTDSARRITKEPLFPLNFAEYQILKHENFFPPKEMAKNIRDLILNGNSALIPVINTKFEELKKINEAKKIDLKNEIETYFQAGGFAFTIRREKRDAYSKLMDLIDRIIKTDLPTYRNFESSNLTKVFRLLGFIAGKKSGEISQPKLAKALETSPDNMNTLLDTLEKTQLIFSIKPLPTVQGMKSWAGSPWKYFFLSPTLTYALRYTLGKTTLDTETIGLLRENLVAATLFKLAKTISRQISIFYDRQDEGVDFLLQNDVTGQIIPIEVGTTKEKGQVEDAIKRFKSEYGILIADYDKLFIQDKVIHIPFEIFVFG